MPTATVKVPAVYGGVSRQPPHLRYPHQVEDASNALFSVVDGFSKRPGTSYLRTIAGLSGTDFRLHKILRDSGERYIVLYGPATLRVFELGGPECTVTVSDTAAGYLASNVPTSDQLRLVSEVDSTFILNTTVPLGTVRGLTYVVTGVWSTYEVMVTSTPPANTYHQTLTSTTNHPAGYWRYTGSVGGLTTLASIRFQDISGSFLAFPAGFWDNAGQGPWGFKLGFQRMTVSVTAGAWTASSKTLTQAGAFTDFEFTTGQHIYVTGGTTVTAGWYEIASKVSNDAITTTTNIAAADQTDITAQGIGVQVDIDYARDNPTLASMTDIAAKIQGLLVAGGAVGALCSWTNTGHPAQFGSPALLRGYFTITSPYGGNQATMTLPSTPTTGTDWSAAGWPFTAATAVVTTGTGTAGGTPAWESVPAPDTTTDIDATKMPVRMQRTAVSHGTAAAAFSVDTVPWNARATGDDDTNPIPDPWTRALRARDLKFWQDRLCIAAGEFIVMSQAADYFNYFIADSQNLVDSDPVVLQLSSEDVTVIDYLVAYHKAIVAFTLAGRQFQVSFTDTLTPSSASVTLSTSYTSLPVRPRAMGQRLYFLASAGYASQLMEYTFDEQAVVGVADNVSAHVPGYLPASPRSLETSQNNNAALVIGTGLPTIWVYRAFWSGDTKQQSAWDTYDFDSGCVVADLTVIEDYCYFLVKKDGLWAMERFSIPQEPKCVPIETVQ